MIRMLISALRPTNAQLRKRKLSWPLSLQIWLHARLVTALAHFYRKYAVHDLLRLADGTSVQIEERDLDFEHEMSVARIDTKLRFSAVVVPMQPLVSEPIRLRWFRGCFNWHRSVTLRDAEGRCLVIDHTAKTAIGGDRNLKAELSPADSFISAVRVTQRGTIRRSISNIADSNRQEPESTTSSRPQVRRRRRIPPPSEIPRSLVEGEEDDTSTQPEVQTGTNKGRRSPAPEPIPASIATKYPGDEAEQPPATTPPPTLKEMRGFDLDDSF